mgnify:CR=1 FL=1
MVRPLNPYSSGCSFVNSLPFGGGRRRERWERPSPAAGSGTSRITTTNAEPLRVAGGSLLPPGGDEGEQARPGPVSVPANLARGVNSSGLAGAWGAGLSPGGSFGQGPSAAPTWAQTRGGFGEAGRRGEIRRALCQGLDADSRGRGRGAAAQEEREVREGAARRRQHGPCGARF